MCAQHVTAHHYNQLDTVNFLSDFCSVGTESACPCWYRVYAHGIEYAGVWHWFISIFSWASLRCAQVGICHREQLIEADLLEGWIKYITVHLYTDNCLCGVAKCALHLTIFLNVTSFYRVTGTAELTKANFLLRTERLFQTQTYSGQTPRQMHVICLEESYGLSEPVNIWLVQNEGMSRILAGLYLFWKPEWFTKDDCFISKLVKWNRV